MHGSAHLKPLGHEVQGSYYVGGKRKKPHNPDEVGAVKDHFSEGRQQENQRPPSAKQIQQLEESDVTGFEEADRDLQGLYQPRIAEQAGHALAAELAVQAIRSQLNDTMPLAGVVVTKPDLKTKTVEPSFDDLLAMMRVDPILR
jgi:hypothetical protein